MRTVRAFAAFAHQTTISRRRRWAGGTLEGAAAVVGNRSALTVAARGHDTRTWSGPAYATVESASTAIVNETAFICPAIVARNALLDFGQPGLSSETGLFDFIHTVVRAAVAVTEATAPATWAAHSDMAAAGNALA